jgi:GntR family transcriptional regulator / MocR family aminotransferase
MDTLDGLLTVDHAAGDLEGQIYRGLRDGILAGRLVAGQKLPATRPMARAIGVGRSTIVQAFERLREEGYIGAVQGSFTQVSPLLAAPVKPEDPRRPISPRRPGTVSAPDKANDHAAFVSGVPDLSAFPTAAWARCLGARARSLRLHDLGYGSPEGLVELRAAILAHVAETRGVVADPDQIIILPSTSVAIDLIARLLLRPGDTAWIEEPGYPAALSVLRNSGARLVSVPCDMEGINPAAAKGPAPRLIFVTPSHQYPTGVTMSLTRRLALLDAAAAVGAVILEDDYDSDFQYGGRRIAALQGIDRSASVAYLGTFSKTLAPGICVAYAILPHWLLERVAAAPWHRGLVPIHVQAALADFIRDGHLRAHIRRMNALYRERMDAALAALHRHCGTALIVPDQRGGLQLAAFFWDATRDDVAMAAALRQRAIAAKPLSQFYLETPRPGLLLGISLTPPAEADAAAERMGLVFAKQSEGSVFFL